MKKAFLSSTQKDLEDYHSKAYNVINKLDNYKCISMRDFDSRNEKTANFCKRQVANCDLFICLIGHFYGSSPIDSELSYTEIEYREAVKHNKPRLIFIASSKVFVRYDLIDSEKRNKQDVFKYFVKINDGLLATSFDSPEDLAEKMHSSIYNFELNADHNIKERIFYEFNEKILEESISWVESGPWTSEMRPSYNDFNKDNIAMPRDVSNKILDTVKNNYLVVLLGDKDCGKTWLSYILGYLISKGPDCAQTSIYYAHVNSSLYVFSYRLNF
jgi:hypothetical protein